MQYGNSSANLQFFNEVVSEVRVHFSVPGMRNSTINWKIAKFKALTNMQPIVATKTNKNIHIAHVYEQRKYTLYIICIKNIMYWQKNVSQLTLELADKTPKMGLFLSLCY